MQDRLLEQYANGTGCIVAHAIQMVLQNYYRQLFSKFGPVVRALAAVLHRVNQVVVHHRASRAAVLRRVIPAAVLRRANPVVLRAIQVIALLRVFQVRQVLNQAIVLHQAAALL